jgi:anti-sigma factor RsiW
VKWRTLTSGERGTNLPGSSGFRWNQNDMVFWAVSDLDSKELQTFVRNLQAN